MATIDDAISSLRTQLAENDQAITAKQAELATMEANITTLRTEFEAAQKAYSERPRATTEERRYERMELKDEMDTARVTLDMALNLFALRGCIVMQVRVFLALSGVRLLDFIGPRVRRSRVRGFSNPHP